MVLGNDNNLLVNDKQDTAISYIKQLYDSIVGCFFYRIYTKLFILS